MLNGKRIVVVLPAYNAARTLERTIAEIPPNVVDEILLVDDFSTDETVDVAQRLGLTAFRHERNYGYGRNQKTCYAEALRRNADVVVMLHPDYQYQPSLVLPMAALIASGVYDVVLASRILSGTARAGGMPLYKVHRQSRADARAEHDARRQVVGIPLRLSRLRRQGASFAAAAAEF